MIDTLALHCKDLQPVVIVDPVVLELWGKPLAEMLGAKLIVAPKEKSRKAKELIEDQLFEWKMGKDTVLIAVGGGTTTDLVGFVASTYLRGVALILVPTTLLAMVDASVGGKTAIDTPFGKNLLGSFYPPKAVVVDLKTLDTLPKSEIEAGLVEVKKLALVYKASLIDRLGRLEELVFLAIKTKQEIVAKDPMDLGIRRILNFGHTIGHGLEAVSNYQMSHGDAVAIGCVVEAHLSMQLGYLSMKDFEKIQSLFAKGILPSGYALEPFLEAMLLDKKNKKGEIRFVLLDTIGHAIEFDGAYCRSVGVQELTTTLDWMESYFG
jgi:3-dehydroquinate synthase